MTSETYSIFVPTCSAERCGYFLANYNVYDRPTGGRFIFIVDTRMVDLDQIKQLISKSKVPYSMTMTLDDLIVNSHLDERGIALEDIYHLIEMFPLMLKTLIPLLARRAGITKFMMLDDDILYLKPFDYLFAACANAVRPKSNCPLKGDPALNMFSEVFPDLSTPQLQSKTHLINSGQMILTVTDILLDDIRSLWASELVRNSIAERYLRGGGMTRGTYYLTEEYFWGIHFRYRATDVYHFTSEEVRLVVADLTKKKGCAGHALRSLPRIIHLLPRDKLAMFEHYTKAVSQYLDHEAQA